MENCNGLVVASEVRQATGRAERESDLRMVRPLRGSQQKTLGLDKRDKTREFVADLRISSITPHVAHHIQVRRGSAIDVRTVRH